MKSNAQNLGIVRQQPHLRSARPIMPEKEIEGTMPLSSPDMVSNSGPHLIRG